MQLNPELHPIAKSQPIQEIWMAVIKHFGKNRWITARGYDTKEELVNQLELGRDCIEEYYIYKLTMPIDHIH